MTAAATVPLVPDAASGSGAGATADDDLAEVISWADFRAWERQLATTGGCRHPVRLDGSITAVDTATGEAAVIYDTGTEPGGVLHVPCGNRRESVCPPCSHVYKGDARQLVKAGLIGGKGIPDTIAAHPCVFATLTAPGFGPVHTRRTRGKTVLPCRPRRDTKTRRCPHGRDISCPMRHHDQDPRLGRALCRDCYDYTAAAVFNANAGKLWRRFTTYLPRMLARRLGITQKRLRALARVRYVKVAEYQARGVVHFHAVIRLDAPGAGYQPPAANITADLLCRAIQDAAAAVALTMDVGADRAPIVFGFGPQTDTRPIRPADQLPGTGHALSHLAVANYIAKYATKTLTAPGLPDTRLRSLFDIRSLRCSRHYKAMMVASWRLAARAATGDQRYQRWAHMLSYGGHFLTKSRAYSTTFGKLRRARTQHRRAQRHPGGETDPWGRPLDDAVVLVLADWSYAGRGYTTAPGAELALATAAHARDHECPGNRVA